jgi:hypothetical protein
MAKDLPIGKLLRECGYASDTAQAAGREALDAAGVTRPGKDRIVEWKRPDVVAVLKARVTLLCGPCREAGLGHDYPEATMAGAGDRCVVCEGSATRRGALILIRACQRARFHRVIFVGGNPDVHRELPLLLSSDLDVRVVDGMTSRPGRDVQREIDGCDVVVLLGSTEISHTVSATWAGPKTVATQSRGISAFLLEAAEKIDARAGRAGL